MFPKYKYRNTVQGHNKSCSSEPRNPILTLWITVTILLLLLVFYANYQLRTRFIDVFHHGNVRNFQIFQIGFNKCGTRSIEKFFKNNTIPALHWIINSVEWHSDPKRNIAPDILSKRMFDAYIKNKPDAKLMGTLTDSYTYFGDFGVYFAECQDLDILFVNKSAVPWYQILVEQYPYSVYILNIRNVNHWIKSRYIHYHFYQRDTFGDGGYLNLIKSYAALDIRSEDSDLKLLKLWKAIWYQYICGVIHYFDTNNLMDRLLIFDVERDDIEKMTLFLDWYGVKLNGSLWGKQGVSNYSGLEAADAGWDYVIARYPQFAWWHSHYDNIERNEIVKKCQISDSLAQSL